MSHFTVLVVGNDVDRQLAPFHEFECTGVDDEYVQEIDITEKARAEYQEHTVTRLRDPQGVLHDPYTVAGEYRPEFCTTEKAIFGDRQVLRVPEGWTEVKVPGPEAGQGFLDFVQEWYGIKPAGSSPDLEGDHKYGYVKIVNGDVTVIDRTNPNRKWDWYCVGGRWTGHWKMKRGRSGVVGKPGLMTEEARPGYADSALKGDIDFEAMKTEAQRKANLVYDKIERFGTERGASWKEIRESVSSVDEARTLYHAQPWIQALQKADLMPWNGDPHELFASREHYVEDSVLREITTWAVLKDGQWHEYGKMGWWGMSSDDDDDWPRRCMELIESLPDDTLLTIVDCHI